MSFYLSLSWKGKRMYGENISIKLCTWFPWTRIQHSCLILGQQNCLLLSCFLFITLVNLYSSQLKINCAACYFSAIPCITLTLYHTFTPGSSPVKHHWGASLEYLEVTQTLHTLYTHTLLGGRSHTWSWPLRSHSRGEKHTPFSALDLQRGGSLHPLERRGQEIQRVGLLMWIPWNLTTYRKSKHCLKSSRDIYRCQSLVLKGPGKCRY